ncbi:hypothetical protein FLK61_24465 [Paenalkalicoccus suaedae]|uniref:Uncharacterized protein n=1 Tax=Paenalkalicoccus suaedae TaxID=2592382 RepID=A0A859FAH4_9BACI|nr:hypothetical protein [Paenalkalicoccus suaedae]QKS69937.1 hypothetical protein FLK61_24465 [Paenalkalicoccus suaedae]
MTLFIETFFFYFPFLLFFFVVMLIDYPVRRGRDKIRKNEHKSSFWIGAYGVFFILFSLITLAGVSGTLAMSLTYSIASPVGLISGIVVFIGLAALLANHVDMRTNFYARYLEE